MRFCWIIVVLALGMAAQASAESLSLSSKARSDDVLSRQFDVIDSRAATQYRAAGRSLPSSVARHTDFSRLRGFSRYRGVYLEPAKQAARRHGIPEDLFLRLVQQESAWNPNAVSHKGAIGLAQLMPQTARALGVNPRDPEENLDGGARYLRRQYEKFRSWPLALAAYNAGPQAVEKHGGIPPYRETQNYVTRIWGEN